MMRPMRIALNVLCGFTLLASSWLAVMFLVLHRPGYERGVSLSLVFILQSLLTLGVTTGLLSALWWRLLAVTGVVGIVWAGAAAVSNTLTGSHFEGYALIIGVALVLQGLLTAGLLITPLFTFSSKMHRFGN
jgi:hypothetical protein